MDNIEKHIKLKSNLEQYEKVNSHFPNFVQQVREEAKQRFAKNGLPNKKTEDYLYTNVSSIVSDIYKQEVQPSGKSVDIETLFKCAVPDLDTYNIFIENGWYSSANKQIEKLMPKGVTICGFQEAITKYPELVQKHFNTLAKEHQNSLADINTMLMQDGVFVYLQDGVMLDKPIQIINLQWGKDDVVMQVRNLFIAGNNASVKIIMCDHTLSDSKFMSNRVSELFVSDSANVDFYNSQNLHDDSCKFTSLYVNQQRNSNSRIYTLTLNGGLVRNNVFVKLAEEHAHCDLFGLSLLDNKQHVDNFTMIDHAVPNCTSNEMYKNILDDESTGAFSGKIMVRPDAQKTQAFQSNKNILLTDTARFNTKPQLEIYADDVKCSHGATVGQINEEALFYLRARGINEEYARKMLMLAFANELIAEISVPALADRYADLIEKRLNGELKFCKGCVNN